MQRPNMNDFLELKRVQPKRPNMSDLLDLNNKNSQMRNNSPYKTFENGYKETFVQRQIPRNIPVRNNMIQKPNIMYNHEHDNLNITPIHTLEGFKNMIDSDIDSDSDSESVSSKSSNKSSPKKSPKKTSKKTSTTLSPAVISSPCIMFMNHIQDCPVCQKLHCNNGNATVYIIVIVLLSLFILLLLKKVLQL